MARTPGGPGSPGSDMSWEEIWERLTGKAREVGEKQGKKWPWKWIITGVVIVIWLLTGIYTVGPGEVGVVRTFGEHTGTTNPGLNYHWPWPFQSVINVNIEEIRLTEIGFYFRDEDKEDYEPESKMLTGDGNIAKVWLQVQYQVSDPESFVFNVRDPQVVIHTAAEVVLRGVIGQMDIDNVLTTGRDIVGEKSEGELQQLLDSYGTGLKIYKVNVIDIFPPEQVNAAYEDVSTAKQETDKKINEAQAYAADKVPKAKGEKEKLILEAKAYREKRILEAQGDSEKFLSILREHEVPASFSVLADNGYSEALRILDQSQSIRTGSQSVVYLSRETLYEILIQNGAISGTLDINEVTGQNLLNAFASLGLTNEYKSAYIDAINLTENRLYLETMEDVLVNTERFVVDPSTSSSLVPFLPLKELTGTIEPPLESEQSEEVVQ